MNSLLKNIIEKSATGILIYAGKRLIDKGIICWDERKKKKEAIPADHTAEKSDKTITPVSMKEIIERNKPQSAVSHQRGLFAPGELHVICAQTGMGKSIFSVEMGLAMAGGKESEPYAIVKSILGDKWDATKQRVMGEETSIIPTLLPWFLPERYHPLMTWKSTSASVPKKANTGKTARSSLTIPAVMMEATIPIVCRSFINP